MNGLTGLGIFFGVMTILALIIGIIVFSQDKKEKALKKI